MAAVLFGIPATVVAADLSKNVDCFTDEGVMDFGVSFGSALAGFGVLTLTWTWRWRWRSSLAAAAFVVTFIPIAAVEILMALGKCTN